MRSADDVRRGGDDDGFELKETNSPGGLFLQHNDFGDDDFVSSSEGTPKFELHVHDGTGPRLQFEKDDFEDREEDHNDDFDVITIEDGQRTTNSHMTPEQEATFRSRVRWAIIMSWFSVTVDLIFGFVGLFIALSDKSVGIFGFALENFLDVITSFLIIWRFGGFSRKELVVGNPEHDDKMERREQRAAVLIALLFVILGTFTCVIALVVLYENESPDDVLSVIIISSVSIIVLAFLGIIKFYLAIVLKSGAFRQDAWVTTVSSVLSIGLLTGSVVYHLNSDVWFIDSLVALPLGGFLLAYGFYTLATRKWWRLHFWGYYQSTDAPVN